jgi:hypothetical protein
MRFRDIPANELRISNQSKSSFDAERPQATEGMG